MASDVNKRNIPFSPPDITDAEIAEVAKALKSGWITTGPRTKLFEKKIAEYTGTSKRINNRMSGKWLCKRRLFEKI